MASRESVAPFDVFINIRSSAVGKYKKIAYKRYASDIRISFFVQRFAVHLNYCIFNTNLQKCTLHG